MSMSPISYPKHSLNLRDDIQATSLSSMKTIRKLDKSVEKLSGVLDKKIQDLTRKSSSTNNSSHVEEMQEIRKIKQAIEVLAGKKVEIAKRHYDFIDLTIKSIDTELNTLEKGLNFIGKPLNPESQKYEAQSSPKKRGRPRLGEVRPAPQQVVEVPSPTYEASNPHEPVYCICKRVAFGDMIACDNEDCPIEWFHYSCVNLTKQPRNSWICPICSNKRRK